MSKPSHISRYYADDKDVLDLVLQSAISAARLAEFLRKRGIMLSPQLERDEVARYFQMCPLSRAQLVELLDLIGRPDREDKFSNHRFDDESLNLDEVVAAIERVKAVRGTRHNEVYTTEVSQDGTVAVSIAYVEPDFSRTRLLQKAEKSLAMTFGKTGTGVQVRSHDNERGHEVLNAIEKELAKPDSPPPRRKEIVVTGLPSTARSRFFVELARGIAGYELKDSRGLRVDRPDYDDGIDDEEEDQEVDGGRKDFEGLVKRAMLHGTGLLFSREYQEYAKQGFSISKLVWTVEGNVETDGWVEFSAEFQNGAEGNGFKYGVTGHWERKEDGERAKVKKTVGAVAKDRLLSLLESSAYDALAVAASSVEPEGEPLTVEDAHAH